MERMVLRRFAKVVLIEATVLIQSTVLLSHLSHAFTLLPPQSQLASFKSFDSTRSSTIQSKLFSESPTRENNDEWKGEVVSNSEDGTIRGCSITKVDGTLSEWIIQVDGIEADLGKFSEAIYRKICSDAKQQRFQGFRPGTIPPHLVPTYMGFTMDECAREATLEALNQNEIKPFDDSRMEMTFDTISILPPRKNSKQKKGGRKKKASPSEDKSGDASQQQGINQWLTFQTMKEAIDGGWKPGQSFSFIARNVKGQKLNTSASTVSGAEAIGASGSALNLNTIQFDGE